LLGTERLVGLPRPRNFEVRWWQRDGLPPEWQRDAHRARVSRVRCARRDADDDERGRSHVDVLVDGRIDVVGDSKITSSATLRRHSSRHPSPFYARSSVFNTSRPRRARSTRRTSLSVRSVTACSARCAHDQKGTPRWP
jgi:hypothetical protein